MARKLLEVHADGSSAVVEDDWELIEDAEAENDPDDLRPRFVHVSQWQAAGCPAHLAPWLGPDDEPEVLADAAPSLERIGVVFPAFVDGRGLSTAVMLRTHFGFTGELRALGDVVRDDLWHMHRCGFTAFALNDEFDPQAAAASVIVASDNHQADVNQRLPPWRRAQRT